jgi:hypothetical protein
MIVASPTGTPATVAWTRGSSAQCHCSAEFPFPAKASTMPIDGGVAGLLLAEQSGNPLSAAIFSASNASAAPTIDDLDALLRSVASGHGDIVESAAVTGPDGLPSMTATLHQGTGVSRVKVFVANGTSYVVLMGATNGNVSGADFDRFAKSFSLS